LKQRKQKLNLRDVGVDKNHMFTEKASQVGDLRRHRDVAAEATQKGLQGSHNLHSTNEAINNRSSNTSKRDHNT
jgi:hypothetical protein